MLEARGLSFAYGFRRVFANVRLTAAPGEVVAILGPNGAGKSTLLRVLSGLLAPTAGTVRWWGSAPGDLPADLRVRAAIVGHRHLMYEDLTARENLVYYAALLGLRDPRAEAAAALRDEGLAVFADQRLSAFSRGMAQRLSICRAWLGDPELVFADEPATGLDPEASVRLGKRLRRLREAGGTALLVAHDLAGALAVADRFIVLAGGGIAAAAPSAPWQGRSEAFLAHYREVVARARGARRGAAAAAAAAWAARSEAEPGAGRVGGAGGHARGAAPAGAGEGARDAGGAVGLLPAAPGDAPPPAAAVRGGREATGPLRPGPARPRAATALRAVFARDMRLWWRGADRGPAVLAYGILVALVFGFAFNPAAVPVGRLFAGILWLGLLFTGLPAFARGFAAEWEHDAAFGALSSGASATVLFYGKCLANLAGFVAVQAVLVPVFFALMQVRAGSGALAALGSLLLGTLGFVPAGTLVAALVGRVAGSGQGALSTLVGLPLLSPVVFGTAWRMQGYLSGTPEMPGVWALLLLAYAVLFWGLPALLFPLALDA